VTPQKRGPKHSAAYPTTREPNLYARVNINIASFDRFPLKKEAIGNKQKEVPENGPKVIGAYRF
jgi:hypothetical protein